MPLHQQGDSVEQVSQPGITVPETLSDISREAARILDMLSIRKLSEVSALLGRAWRAGMREQQRIQDQRQEAADDSRKMTEVLRLEAGPCTVSILAAEGSHASPGTQSIEETERAKLDELLDQIPFQGVQQFILAARHAAGLEGQPFSLSVNASPVRPYRAGGAEPGE
jgi:hypothetical protein